MCHPKQSKRRPVFCLLWVLASGYIRFSVIYGLHQGFQRFWACTIGIYCSFSRILQAAFFEAFRSGLNVLAFTEAGHQVPSQKPKLMPLLESMRVIFAPKSV